MFLCSYIVRLGELDYARDNDGANPIDFLIKRMIIHEEYDPNFKTNDIGLLILQSDVTFTSEYNIIGLINLSYYMVFFSHRVRLVAMGIHKCME